MSEDESNLEEELTFSPKNIWEDVDDEAIEDILDFSADYMDYITKSKTEREAVNEAVKILEDNGFKDITDYDTLEEGDKFYLENRNKTLALGIIGEDDITEGCRILASHIDSPRLDLKARPLYEDKDSLLSLLKTHYYGGIKKYQWVNTPLAIHGRIVKEDGEKIDIEIGEDEADPVFIVSDLLPHLSKKKQGERKMKEVIKGEELNVVVGSRPIDDEDIEETLKINVLKILNDMYGIKEEDFTSAEIEVVPAGPAREVGLDRSLVGAYGQDDRICGYTTMMAAIDTEKPRKTSLVFLFDKEEIGSVGNTGASSVFIESVVSKILSRVKADYDLEDYRDVLENSKALSGDVGPAVNPSFKGVHEMRNACKLGRGLVITKFTGAGGKYSANDAHAEYVAYVRRILNENDIPWQTSELGKVDEGGGGTVARFIARLNIDVIDAGPALLGMHSPFEVTSKADIYNIYKGYKAFLESK